MEELGCLPEYNNVNKPSEIKWGKRSDGSVVIILSSTIINAYDWIVTWRENVFLLPYGKTGRDFIDQVTLHINEWNNDSENQHVSQKAAFVLIAVALPKPSKKNQKLPRQKITRMRCLNGWRCEKRAKSINCLGKKELLKVVSESIRGRTPLTDLRSLLSSCLKGRLTQHSAF